MAFDGFDIVDTAFIDTSPDVVWKELVAELNGGAGWWVPKNTFRPGPVGPDKPGGETEVTVHPKGVDKGGPKLRFVARTTEVEPGRRLAADYVSGAFAGTCEYLLEPAAGGRRTRLSMHFRATPRGIARVLGKLADIGLQHSQGTQAAFGRLNQLVGGSEREPAAGGDAHVRTVRTSDGARLAVSVLGPPVGSGTGTAVLSHGWAAGRKAWLGVAGRLAGLGYTVVSYDQRGHGESTLGSEPVGVRRLGDDLAAVLAAVDARDAVLAGHSGGGFAAMSYVIEHADDAAERVRGLVLLGTAAHDRETPDSEVRLMGNPVFSWAVSRGPLGRRMLRSTMGPKPTASALETNRRLFAATPRRVRADFFRSSRGMDLRAGLSSVDIPAIVLAGTADTVIDPGLGRVVAETLPNARYEQVADTGHMLPLESPGRVADVIAELGPA
ncbi:alpha/beta fold hydrolase [Actinophytocola gossypii]|uniref:Alpha/beta fold hydrolase n=1 Tax=Actinophytocola gossypii TaxID=2812003 RepID=A0ABT2J282_9PSEU|nr:alpha/beta fold hydrolase [Actinophytocola gossypii]MCT2581962.1 alpha/beta fold hydrolase [Actinophytocola gossypii]